MKFIMYEKLLFWIEVMSILVEAHEVFAILKKALEWPGLAVCLEFIFFYITTLRLARQILDPKNELMSFIRDAVRFISVFLVPISQSAPQIYLSALPFTPECSLVGKKFRPRFPNTLTISDGRPSQWPKNVFVAEHHKNSVECIALSPDEKTFVCTSLSFSPPPPLHITTSYVCDSETGHCISGPFEESKKWLLGRTVTCFSPDGKHVLVRYRRKSFYYAVVWEIETGEKVSQIEGFDFVFIHCGRNKGRIASVDWMYEDGFSIRTIASTDSEDEDGSSIRTIASTDSEDGSSIRTIASTYSEDEDGFSIQIITSNDHLTRILVKLWDIGTDISDRRFEVIDVAVTRFSPNGQYLAVGKRSENVVQLWNLEDGESTHRFSYPLGDISSLHFSSTSDCLMAAFEESLHKCLWRLDTQEMTSFDLGVGDVPPAIIHSPNANRLFVPRHNAVEVWEVSMTSSDMIFKTEPLTTSWISSICPLRDGHRILVGSHDGTVRMRNMEDWGSSQPVIQDVTDRPDIIRFSPSGKMVATKSWGSDHVELRDTATWELVGSTDVEYKDWIDIAFSADDKRIAFVTRNCVTICDIMHLENRLSFDPWPKGRHVYKWMAAFQTCNDLVICTQPEYNCSCLLQVWKLKDHSECMSSLDININSDSYIFLAPDGLTVIIFTDLFSWNHETAQFDRIHFTDEAHLHWHPLRHPWAYSPDGKPHATIG